MRNGGWLALAAIGLALTACDKNDAGNAAAGNSAAVATDDSLADALGGAGDLGTAAKLVKTAGLDKAFDGVGAYTVFAPTDTALAALPEAQRKAFETADGRPQLISLLRAHIATGYVGRADLDKGLAEGNGAARLASVSGQPLMLRKQGDAVLVGEGDSAARIVGEPVLARNGVIYRIDRVIPPPAK